MSQLDPAAVSSIFHGAPSYLSISRTPIRTSPSKWMRLAQEHEECLQVCTLSDENINRLPTIRFGLRILEDISMILFINGILIHTSQLTWVIGHTNNVLTR